MVLVLLCVVNVSEGRDADVLGELAAVAGTDLLDLHRDPHHHRAVLTLVGEDAPRHVARVALDRIDLREHSGVHPRLGAVDVVPFVPYEAATLADARRGPCRVHGLGRGRAGPAVLRLRARAVAARGAPPGVARPLARRRSPGPAPDRRRRVRRAREVLVAYNTWLAEPDLAAARRVAAAVRGPRLRALGLPVGQQVQVSMNLVAPDERRARPRPIDAVAAHVPLAGAELVGLVPERVLHAVPPARWDELDLSEDRTVEARLAHRTPAW